MSGSAGEKLSAAAAATALTTLNEQEVVNCTRCAELAATRTQTVFGVGDPRARLCFLGEAPGADEDRLGEPFVGRAGQLLTRIIEACTLRREDVYILNVIKCRPPGNRNPTPEEVGHCRGFLERQLAIIQPEFIVCLGAVAATNLLDTRQPLSQLRGRFHDWRGVRVMVTYHPAYLLRNPPAKADVWRDMQWLMKVMGIENPTTFSPIRRLVHVSRACRHAQPQHRARTAREAHACRSASAGASKSRNTRRRSTRRSGMVTTA